MIQHVRLGIKEFAKDLPKMSLDVVLAIVMFALICAIIIIGLTGVHT